MAGTATGQSSYSGGGTVYYDLTKATGDRAQINSALFFQNKPDSSSGTGLIQAIVRVQDPGGGDGHENGYNTSHRPLSYEENTSPNFTTSLLLNSVPVVTIDGTQYYEFRLDINQLNSSSYLSLDEIKLFSSDVSAGQAEGLIGGTWFTNNATLVYDMDGAGNTSILLDAALSSGSGSSDMFFYVPVSNFGSADPDVTYVTLYSEFGAADVLDASDNLVALDDPANTHLNDNGDDTGDLASKIFGTYTANDGFEEWSVSKQTGGVISGFKWNDSNGNGQWNVGETGLAGWTIDYTISFVSGHGGHKQTVTLTGSVVTSDGTVDVDGDGVIDPVGFYSIFVPASTDKNETYTITLTEHSQTGWINTYDGDATANSTTTFTFSGNDLNLSGSTNISGHQGVTEQMNFGNFETFSISGHKYTDITGNGLTGDDTGLGGVTIFIDVNGDGLNNDGYSTVTANGSTDANHDGLINADDVGYFEFTGLTAAVAGKEIKEITPSGYIQTVGQVGSVTDTNYVITGTSGTDQTNIDFANFEKFTISGHKYTDITGNGLSGDDTGLAGVTIFIDVNGNGLNDDGFSTVTADGSTDANHDGLINADDVGYWELTNLDWTVAGKEVKEITPTGYVQTVGQVGTVTDTSSAYTLVGTSGHDQTGLDFANFETFTISGHKYTDLTGDGITSDDTGLGGVTIFIDVNGNGVNDDGYSTVTSNGSTDANHDGLINADDVGYWEMTGLTAAVAGKEVKEITPSGYIQTVGQIGTVDDTSTDYTLVGTSGHDQTGLDFANFLPDPKIDIEKYVMTDVSGAFVDADDPDGPAASASTTVQFKVVVSNTGNESLSGITLTDSVVHTVAGVPSAPETIVYTPDGDPSTLDASNVFVDLNHNTVEDSGEAWINFDTDGDGIIDAGAIATLAPGDSFDLYYSLTSPVLGQHENTASVEALSAISSTTVSDNDDANYYVLESEECVGVRTPGFWANTKWMTFWDGVSGNEPKQAGTPGFASGELLYKVDTNGDHVVNGSDSNNPGLLIGDYNMNGITDAGEDTIYIGLADALKLIKASSKQTVDGKTADGIYMLGRDVVATWLNYLANNDGTTGECIGGVNSSDGTNTPHEFIDAAVDWLQQFASTSNSTSANNLVNSYHDGDSQALFQFDSRIAPSSGAWQNPFLPGEDIPVSAAAMHSALDAYNNTGAIMGVEYCCDADNPVVLDVLSQVHLF